MTCERFEELLSAYIEGGLTAAERAEMDAHRAACPACADLADSDGWRFASAASVLPGPTSSSAGP